MSETRKILKAQLASLNEQRNELLARSAPLRDERDRIKNEAREKVKALDEQIKAIEAPMFQLDTDLGMVAKALGGKRMSDSPNEPSNS